MPHQSSSSSSDCPCSQGYSDEETWDLDLNSPAGHYIAQYDKQENKYYSTDCNYCKPGYYAPDVYDPDAEGSGSIKDIKDGQCHPLECTSSSGSQAQATASISTESENSGHHHHSSDLLNPNPLPITRPIHRQFNPAHTEILHTESLLHPPYHPAPSHHTPYSLKQANDYFQAIPGLNFEQPLDHGLLKIRSGDCLEISLSAPSIWADQPGGQTIFGLQIAVFLGDWGPPNSTQPGSPNALIFCDHQFCRIPNHRTSCKVDILRERDDFSSYFWNRPLPSQPKKRGDCCEEPADKAALDSLPPERPFCLHIQGIWRHEGPGCSYVGIDSPVCLTVKCHRDTH